MNRIDSLSCFPFPMMTEEAGERRGTSRTGLEGRCIPAPDSHQDAGTSGQDPTQRRGQRPQTTKPSWLLRER